MNFDETILVHQLLGRIAYFHVAFIEPALADKPRLVRRSPVPVCCRHRPDGEDRPMPVAADLADTAWRVPIDIVASVGIRTFRNVSPSCCAHCLIQHSAAAIADVWLEVETLTYADCAPTSQQRAGWRARIGVQLADAFDDEFAGHCAVKHRDIHRVDGPPRDRFPLVGELSALWHPPIGREPVTSWLNHCADLTDITQVLRNRRSHERAVTDYPR